MTKPTLASALLVAALHAPDPAAADVINWTSAPTFLFGPVTDGAGKLVFGGIPVNPVTPPPAITATADGFRFTGAYIDYTAPAPGDSKPVQITWGIERDFDNPAGNATVTSQFEIGVLLINGSVDPEDLSFSETTLHVDEPAAIAVASTGPLEISAGDPSFTTGKSATTAFQHGNGPDELLQFFTITIDTPASADTYRFFLRNSADSFTTIQGFGVPEPGPLALACAGLVSVALLRWRGRVRGLRNGANPGAGGRR